MIVALAMLRMLAACALFASCFWCSYLVAGRLTRSASTAERLCAAFLVGVWLLTVGFVGLAGVGWFRTGPALSLWVAATTAAHFSLRGRVPRLRDDLASVQGFLRRHARSPAGAVLFISLSIASLRTLRGLAAPPLAWDSLTYHLTKAARWVETGSMAVPRFPDVAGNYEFFLPYGDVLWAWTMLPSHSDVLLAAAGLGIWFAVLLTTYACARALQADETHALLAGVAAASVPAVLPWLTAMYIDNTMVALFLAGFLFLTRAWVKGGSGNVVLASASLGVLAGAKFNVFPLTVLAIPLLVRAIWRSTPDLRGRIGLSAICALVMAIALPPYISTFIDTGSPVYPFPMSFAGKTIFRGHPMAAPEFAALMARQSFSQPFAWSTFVREMFLPSVESFTSLKPPFLNLGPGALLLFVVVLFTLPRSLANRAVRLPLLYLLVSGALLLAMMLVPPTAIILRVLPWVASTGRYVTISSAACAIIVARIPGNKTRTLLLLCIIPDLIVGRPTGAGPLEMTAIPTVALWLLVPICFLLLAAGARERGSRFIAATLVAISLVVALTGIEAVRDQFRHAYYAEASRGGVFDLDTLYPMYSASAPAWQYVDQEAPRNLAVTAGYDKGLGGNWYLYPLFGRRLQNHLLYLPITADGSIVDYADGDRTRLKGDPAAWIARFAKEKIDYLVTLPPAPIEAEWAERFPEIFKRVAITGTYAGVYRVDAARIPEALLRIH